jgi:hypothetical protein
MFQFLIKAVFHTINVILCWGKNVQNNITPATSLYELWHPITNKLNPLNCWYDSLKHKKKPVPNSCSLFPFPHKNIHSPAGSVPPQSHLTSCMPTKSNLYLDNSSKTVMREPALHRTFHITSTESHVHIS